MSQLWHNGLVAQPANAVGFAAQAAEKLAVSHLSRI
jgi:hypothetical protein